MGEGDGSGLTELHPNTPHTRARAPRAVVSSAQDQLCPSAAVHLHTALRLSMLHPAPVRGADSNTHLTGVNKGAGECQGSAQSLHTVGAQYALPG